MGVRKKHLDYLYIFVIKWYENMVSIQTGFRIITWTAVYPKAERMYLWILIRN